MADAGNPTPVPPSSPDPVPANFPHSTRTGLPSNVAAALACIPLFGGLVFYILEKEDRFVRFYAMQSIIFGGICLVILALGRALTVMAWSIPIASVVFGPLWSFVFAVVKLGLVVLTVIAMVKAFSGVRWEIPFVGPIARKQLGEV
jgi:uncharacterized membrane protein